MKPENFITKSIFSCAMIRNVKQFVYSKSGRIKNTSNNSDLFSNKTLQFTVLLVSIKLGLKEKLTFIRWN